MNGREIKGRIVFINYDSDWQPILPRNFRFTIMPRVFSEIDAMFTSHLSKKRVF